MSFRLGRYSGSNLSVKVALCAFIVLYLPVQPAEAQSTPPEIPDAQKQSDVRCLTQFWYDWQYGHEKMAPGCPQEGICDTPRVRDLWTPEPDQPITTIALFFHILTGLNGSNPALSAEDLAAAVDSMNADYLPYRIQFIYGFRFLSSPQFRSLQSWDECNLMKDVYALDCAYQCNVFVTDVYIDGWSFSWGTYPWEPIASEPRGGVLMHTGNMPPDDYGTLTHEMGHVLGLHHTFHGVSEVDLCGACYESPGQLDNNWVGDFCSDTDPSPENYTCLPPGGDDPCTNRDWGPTQPENHMAYTPLWCRHEFSTQQSARMHCWLNDRLAPWIASVDFNADITSGPAPLNVQFTSTTLVDATSWSWSFGDGGTADGPNPAHTYTESGLHSVSVTVSGSDGTFTRPHSDFIWVFADTLIAPRITGGIDESIRFDIYTRNTLPLDRIEIPFDWNGPLELTFDSVSTAGLRTVAVTNKYFLHVDPLNKRAAYVIDPELGRELPADTGAVLSLYFTCPHALHGQTNSVSIQAYLNYQPLFACPLGVVHPISVPGELVICGVGDINQSEDEPNIADLTYLINYLFRGGPEPPSPATADINGVTGINVADITYFVEFLFRGGPDPVCLL